MDTDIADGSGSGRFYPSESGTCIHQILFLDHQGHTHTTADRSLSSPWVSDSLCIIDIKDLEVKA